MTRVSSVTMRRNRPARAALLLAAAAASGAMVALAGCRASNVGLNVERATDGATDRATTRDGRPAGSGDQGDGSARPDMMDGPAAASDAPEGRALGESCSAGVQCASGICADGVCCASACAGNCEACDLPGQAGNC